MNQQLKLVEQKSDEYDFVKDLNSRYNHFQRLGKKYVNKRFKVFKKDADTIHSLAGYMGADELRDLFKINRDKGVFISGPIGCGKTSFAHILKGGKNDSEFLIINASKITDQFMLEGPPVIDRYVNSYPILFIDDVGRESEGMFFGNKINVIQQILKRRCEKLQFKGGVITHISTISSVPELKGKYGDDIMSIMTALFNPILFEDDSIDKRFEGL